MAIGIVSRKGGNRDCRVVRPNSSSFPSTNKGLHVHDNHVKMSPLEAEMRKRVWWSISVLESGCSKVRDGSNAKSHRVYRIVLTI